MEEWKEYKLGDIADIQTGPFGSQLHQRDYVDVGTPCIMPTNIGTQLDIKPEGIAHVKKEDVIRLKKHCVNEGDIIYSRRGDIEKCAYVSQREKGWLCGTGCLRIRINSKNVNPHFIAYQLSTKESKKWIVGNAVGTTMLNLNSGILKELPLLMPNRQKQDSVVDILKSLDEKIEVNRRINENLEQQAQALFKSWFVDFEPFKDQPFVESELGMIPQGWRVGTLGDICVTNKRTYKGDFVSEIEYLDTGCVTNNIIDTPQILNPAIDKIPSRARRAVTEGDIIYSSVRPNQRHYALLFNPSSNTVVSTGFVVITANWSGYRYYIYQYLIQDEIVNKLQAIAEQSVSTFPSLNASDLTNLKIVIPPNDVVGDFAALNCSFITQINKKQQESRCLAELRDTLLPRLMSGELKVNDLENNEI